MADHVHVGIVSTAATVAICVATMGMMRAVEMRWPNSLVGKAFAVLH